ncbi:hypothetical protein [Spirosoma endophyticum]|uniref:Uncharacterized protein n=1 Tax=Spirosoma endophyticum TaxID=662367 RepID=A0A1I1U945_9BACT|nr:hypothetical protein [Spirosoma endophyticum]SFD67362.1 hypothetical protein SAMN05216167_106176 [Spirosoma endophyticum]
MADLNTIYVPYDEQLDPDALGNALIKYLPAPVGETMANSAEIKADRLQVQSFNAQVKATIADVKLPYTSDVNRLDWLATRIKAVSNRTNLIRQRVGVLNIRYAEAAAAGTDNAFTIFNQTASALPVVGAAFGWVGALAKREQAQYNLTNALGAKQSIEGYTADAALLARINKQLLDEYQASNLSPTDETVSNAATAIPTWYYFVGAGLLLIFLLWLKQRNSKRGRR